MIFPRRAWQPKIALPCHLIQNPPCPNRKSPLFQRKATNTGLPGRSSKRLRSKSGNGESEKKTLLPPSTTPRCDRSRRGERVDPAFAMAEPTPGEDLPPELRLVRDRSRGSGAAQWLGALRGLWVENYRSLCQSATLIALGAAMALLAVGFSRRHSPLPARVQTQRPQTVRPEASAAKARRKRPHSPTSLRDAAKRLASPKKQSNLIPLKPSAGGKIVPGIRLASERVAAERRQRPNFSRERDFVANDSVTRHGAQDAPAPK